MQNYRHESYDSADRPLWMKYPGGSASQIGEQVHYAYTTQGLLDTVQSNGGVYYVGKTQYNELCVICMVTHSNGVTMYHRVTQRFQRPIGLEKEMLACAL